MEKNNDKGFLWGLIAGGIVGATVGALVAPHLRKYISIEVEGESVDDEMMKEECPEAEWSEVAGEEKCCKKEKCECKKEQESSEEEEF